MKKISALLILVSVLKIAAQPGPQAPAPALDATNGVDIERTLMITDLRVIEDRRRTNPNNRNAPWTFRNLMEQMAGEHDPADFTLAWLRLWEQDQTINDTTSAARSAIREQIIDPWMAASGGERLDLSIAPFKLLAIVNRMDLREHDGDGRVESAGEGRFVFGALTPDGLPLPPMAGTAPGGFMVIFEYGLLADNMQSLRDWTLLWNELGSLPLGSEVYNAHLEAITRRFSDRRNNIRRLNNNAINQIRTNEVALALPWELREFVISRRSGLLEQQGVNDTPDTFTVNGTRELANLINRNEAEILAGTFDLRRNRYGASSMSGPFQATDIQGFDQRRFQVNVFFDPFLNIPWSDTRINSNEARHLFALNTCNGCHRDETGTEFLQIGFPEFHGLPESLNVPAHLAEFLTGVLVEDPVDPNIQRQFNDLQRRQQDFATLVESFNTTEEVGGPRVANAPRFAH